jgi:hypothetical protein
MNKGNPLWANLAPMGFGVELMGGILYRVAACFRARLPPPPTHRLVGLWGRVRGALTALPQPPLLQRRRRRQHRGQRRGKHSCAGADRAQRRCGRRSIRRASTRPAQPRLPPPCGPPAAAGCFGTRPSDQTRLTSGKQYNFAGAVDCAGVGALHLDAATGRLWAVSGRRGNGRPYCFLAGPRLAKVPTPAAALAAGAPTPLMVDQAVDGGVEMRLYGTSRVAVPRWGGTRVHLGAIGHGLFAASAEASVCVCVCVCVCREEHRGRGLHGSCCVAA